MRQSKAPKAATPVTYVPAPRSTPAGTNPKPVAELAHKGRTWRGR